MTYHRSRPQMGSWLSNGVHAVGSWVAGDGNRPGNSDTRTLGYDKRDVGQAAAQILNAPSPVNVQSEILVLGAAGLALIFLLRR